MTDEQPDETASSEAPARRFHVQRVYLKDVSFESPAAPGIFSADANVQPQVNLQLNTETQQVAEEIYEVTLSVTVSGTHEERTVFLVEIKQAGLFQIGGFGEDERHHLLGAHCPGVLFPFAREAVAELVRKGGLPQLVLQPINFDALYAQHLRRQQQGAAEEAGEAGH